MFNPPLGVSVSIDKEQWLSTYKECGIGRIELSLRHNSTEAWAKKMVCKIRSLELKLWSVHLPSGEGWDLSSLDSQMRKETIRRTKKWIELSRGWGAELCIIHSSLEPITNQEREEKLALARESLSILGRAASKIGIKLALECLPRTCLGNTSQEIKYLIDSPNIYVCCDVNHLFKEKPENFIRALGAKIITTHMSDWDGIDERHWLPGDGINNWQEILLALNDVGYKGPFLFEVHKFSGVELQKSWGKICG